jgi:arylsulfatase A-like enzyme
LVLGVFLYGIGCFAAERPNILWISCEDISPDLGCYGDPYATTPNLDQLAAQGCRFTHAYVAFPVCAPSRSAIITGVHPGTLGTMHMRTGNKKYEAVPPSEVKVFTESLRAAGYYCSNHTKTDYQFAVPVNATPVIERTDDGTVTITCATPGASIGYRQGDGERWHIYTGPFASKAAVHAKAIRIGYQTSKETTK